MIKLNTREKSRNNVANNCRQRQVNVLKIVLMTPTHRVISTLIGRHFKQGAFCCFCHIGHNFKKGSLDKTTSSKVRCSQVPQPTCYWKSVESWLGNHSLDKMLSLQARFSWQNAIAGAIMQVLLAKCYLAGVATAQYLTVSLQSLKLLRRTSGRNYVVLKWWLLWKYTNKN